MKSFHLEIVTPDGKKFDGEVKRVIVPTTEGQVGILPNHANYFATLDVGKVRILCETEELVAACSGGFLSVESNAVRIVAITFEFSTDIDIERAERAKERAEIIIAEHKDRAAVDAAKVKLARALARLAVANQK